MHRFTSHNKLTETIVKYYFFFLGTAFGFRLSQYALGPHLPALLKPSIAARLLVSRRENGDCRAIKLTSSGSIFARAFALAR